MANPDLESEEALAYELGYRVQATSAFNVDVALFYTSYEGLKVFVPRGTSSIGAPPGTTFRLLSHENQMDGETRGLELSARWRPFERWELYAAYSLLKMSLHADPALPAANRAMSEAAERQSPEQQLYLQSSLDLPSGAELDLIGRYVDRLAGFQQPVGDYVSMDVRLGWRARENLTLEFVGQNLLDAQHLEVGGSVLAGPLHEIERSVCARAAFSW